MSSWVDLMNSLIIDHYINLILTFTGWPKRITLCRIMTWSRAKLLSVNIESRFSWHNITSAKRAIINVFFLLFLEFCTLDDSESQYSNMWWYVQLYISCQYRLRWFLDSASDNLFAHTQKLCTPLLLLSPSSCRPSLFLYLRPGKLRWWWVFTHPLNYTLSAQLKNPGGPSADLQNSTEILGASSTSKKPSNRIERKIRFFVSLTRFHAFTHKSFVSFFQWLDTVFENHSKRLIFWGFLLIFKHCVI